MASWNEESFRTSELFLAEVLMIGIKREMLTRRSYHQSQAEKDEETWKKTPLHPSRSRSMSRPNRLRPTPKHELILDNLHHLQIVVALLDIRPS